MNADPVGRAMELWLAGEGREAEKLLLAAAEGGSGHAAHNLGTLYACGAPGVEPDDGKSLHWYEKSLESGFEATVATDPTWFRK